MGEFDLHDRLTAAQEHLALILDQTEAPHDQMRLAAQQALEELSTALEELQITEEELREQNDELVQARAGIEAERLRYEYLFEFAPEAYLVTDRDGTITEANSPAVSLFRSRRRFIVGKSLRRFIAREESAAWPAWLAALRDAKQPQRRELDMVDKAGRTFPASAVVVPVRDNAGEVVALRWAIRDISYRKDLEDRLRRLNQIHALLTSVNERIAGTCDADALCQEACDVAVFAGRFDAAWIGLLETGAAEDTAGRLYPVGQHGTHAEALAAALVADGDEDAPQALSELALRGDGPVVVGGEQAALAVRAADGVSPGPRWESIGAFPLRAADETVGVLMLAATDAGLFGEEETALLETLAGDIAMAVHALRIRAALDERSRQIDALFDQALTPLVLLDRDFNFVRVNQACADACQMRISDFEGRNHFELFPSDAQGLFAQAVETKQPVTVRAWAFEFAEHPEWGTSYWDWTLAPILEGAGEVEFLVLALNNVTALVEAHREVQHHKDHLELLVQERTAELRATAERYRSLYAAVLGGVIVVDTRGVVIEINDAACEFLGVERSVAIGADWQGLHREVVHEDGSPFPAEARPVTLTLQTGDRVRDAVLGVSVGDSAQRRWALANSEPLLDPRTGEVRAAVVTFADITALIGAEHEARQRAAELDAVIDSIADGVIIHDRAHRVVRVNDMAKQILQVADEDLQADRAEVVAHVRPHRADGTALPTAEMPSERALHGEIVLGVILTVESREGERTWISESAAPLRDAGGEITGAVATFTDITAQVLGRQRFEELAREAEMRAAEVSTVIDTMVDGVTISDAEGGIVRYNDAARRLLCYETWHESVPYSERLERCQYRRPDGAEFAFEDLPLSRSLRGERVVGETIRMVWPDGTSTWVNSSSAPLCDGEGNVAGAVLTTVDITEQVESRRRIEELGAQSQASLAQLEAVVNSMSEGVVTTDATGMIVDMNPVALRMHGFETVEECRRTIAQYAEFLEVERLDGTPVPPEDFPLARALRGEPNDEATLRWRRTDTGLTWIGVFSYSSIRDADGRIIMTMNTIRDVTAEVEAEHRREQHLQRQAKLLEISQRLLAEHTASGVYQVVVDGARELTGAKLATSGQSFEDGTYRIGSSSRAEGMPPCLQFEVFDMARGGVYTELLETQTSLRLTQEELEAHPRWWGLPEGHAPLRGLLGATIAHGGYGAASGLILLSDKAGDADFTEEDEAAITQLAALASLGLRHIQVRDEAERRAEELDAVIGSMNEGVVVFGQEGVIARANTAAAAVCGFDPTGMDAASLASRLGLRDEAGSFVDVDGLPGVRAIQGERIAGEPYTFVSSESRKTRVLISASPLVVGGRSAGSVAIWHDVTEREALLQQLDQERRLLDAIVAQMPAGLIVAEAPSGRLILQNRQMEAIWGGDPGRAAVTWHGLRLGSGHASGHELRPEEWPLTRTLLTGEMVRHAEINITRLDGSSAVVSCNAGPVHDQDGYVIAGVAIFHDITQSKRVEAALRESEAQMRAVVENMPVMVTAFGRDHADRVAWNRECERVTGYSAEEILGNPRSNELLYPDPGYREIRVRDLQERGHHYRGWEWDVTCKDGTVRTIAWSDISEQVPIPGWSSWSIGVDVTDRRRAEDAERLAAVGQLSAGVAHEFNNLLAVMLLQAELAGETRDVEQYETLVAVVMEAAEQGSGICRDMSLFARPGAPSRYPVQIEEVIDSALNLAGRQVENSGVVVTRDHQAAGRRVYGDPKQLGQVFLNLIINACHAMPRGGDLSVSTRYVQTGSGSGNVVIQISDTGTGITPEHLRRIFEPFFTTKGRLGDSDTPGTGLGLSVSHGIVTAHGGMIEVRSEVGVGTTFEVALPVYEEDAAELASPECAGAPPQSRCCSVQVLVVEDVGVMASLIQTVLTASGHEATCVSDTRAAIASLTACRFDLVVTDLLMPGGGGQEVLTFASTLDDPVPVLVVTGVVGEQMEREAMAMGAAGYVRKPFTRAELIGAVEKILQERGMG